MISQQRAYEPGDLLVADGSSFPVVYEVVQATPLDPYHWGDVKLKNLTNPERVDNRWRSVYGYLKVTREHADSIIAQAKREQGASRRA